MNFFQFAQNPKKNPFLSILNTNTNTAPKAEEEEDISSVEAEIKELNDWALAQCKELEALASDYDALLKEVNLMV